MRTRCEPAFLHAILFWFIEDMDGSATCGMDLVNEL